jgi:hypothetical protein
MIARMQVTAEGSGEKAHGEGIAVRQLGGREFVFILSLIQLQWFNCYCKVQVVAGRRYVLPAIACCKRVYLLWLYILTYIYSY